MADPTPSSRFFRAALFLASVWTVATWIFLIDNNLFSQRERFQESDFIMTFYIAGQLVLTGRSNELYPAPDAKSFIDSPFDKAAHEFLPHLPKESIGAYMYTPLVAGFFAPLSLTGPNYSLLVWQVLSVLALAFSCWLLARVSSAKSSELFFFSALFLPVFLTLWAGQLGLVFGVAPLCAGYFFLLRQRPLAAGVVWSLLLLKPQYFLAAAFVALVLALSGRRRTLAGMTTGVIALLGFTAVVFSPALTWHWLQSHQVSDSIFSAGLHGIPSHLITGLPANLMILFPAEMRAVVKWPLYLGAALLWLVGFAYALKLVRAKPAEAATIPLILVIGLVLCSLTLPHLLYYDLCVLLPAGILLLANKTAALKQFVARDLALIGWIAVSGFLPLLLIFAAWKIVPLVLELILLGLFFILLARLQPLWRSAD
jgi:hypothetical protein